RVDEKNLTAVGRDDDVGGRFGRALHGDRASAICANLERVGEAAIEHATCDLDSVRIRRRTVGIEGRQPDGGERSEWTVWPQRRFSAATERAVARPEIAVSAHYRCVAALRGG